MFIAKPASAEGSGAERVVRSRRCGSKPSPRSS